MEFNPYSYDYFNDPYAIYKHLRDEAPVYYNADLEFFTLSRFRDVLDASLDHETYSSAKGTLLQDVDPAMLEIQPMMIFMDPPRQTRLRKLISRVFTPRRIDELEPQIRSLAVRILEPLVERGSCDIVEEFAAVLPIEVISTMLGVPEEDRTQVRHWSDATLTREAGSPDLPPAAIDAMGKTHRYFCALIAERKRRRQDDMISHLIDVEVPSEDGGTEKLTDAEILGFAGLISGAGNETVTKLLGNAMVLFHRNPTARDAVVADPKRLPNAIEEALRYWPPSQIQGRSLTRDVELHGTTMPAGSRVLLMTGAACRDEREFVDPDRFDIDREIPFQLALGHGAHKCLGAALARLESRVSLEEILARIPRYEVDEANTKRVHMSNVAGYSSVPIRFGRP
jgi:cytochrome P450